tara:strand:+ start:93 stop:518 length:426 start_codon:yes stop_codon:yes gene_type:complete
MIFFNSNTKFSKLEIVEFDSLFLNIHQLIKSEFKLTSRHQQDIKNNPVNGETIFYDFLLEGKDRANIICKKYYIKNKNEYMSFVDTFVHRYKYLPDIEDFPTAFFEILAKYNRKEDGFMFQINTNKDWKEKTLNLIKSSFK